MCVCLFHSLHNRNVHFKLCGHLNKPLVQSSAYALGASVVWHHPLPLINNFNKTKQRQFLLTHAMFPDDYYFPQTMFTEQDVFNGRHTRLSNNVSSFQQAIKRQQK